MESLKGQNMATALPPDFAKKLVREVLDSARSDKKSMEDWLAKRSKHLELFHGKLPSMAGDNITLVHLPLTSKAILMFHAKILRNFNSPDNELVGVKPKSPAAVQKAEVIQDDLNAVLREDIPEYEVCHDYNGIRTLLEGTGFTVLAYDWEADRPTILDVSGDDIYVPYKTQCRFADMRDLPRKTWRRRLYKHELVGAEQRGYYVNVTQGEKPIWPPKPEGEEGSVEADAPPKQGELEQVNVEATGQTPQTDDPYPAREVYEQDRVHQLPDGRFAHVTVAVDVTSETLLRVAERVRFDPVDYGRYQNEKAANEAAHQAQIEQAQAEYQQAAESHAAFSEQMAMEAPDAPPIPPPPPPVPPEAPPEPKQPKSVPFERFFKYDCLPNPEGCLGISLAHLVEGPNIVADEVMSRYVSLLTMHLSPTFLYSRQTKMPRGEFELKLGAGNEVAMAPEQVQAGAGIFQFQFPAPDPNTFKVVDQQNQAAQSVTADDIISGDAGMSGQTATETEIRSSNAMDNIATIASRYIRTRTAEVQALAYLRGITMPPEGVVRYRPLEQADPISGQKTFQVKEVRVTPEDYLDSYDVYFTADPNVASKPQKEKRAVKAYEIVAQLPPGTLDPATQMVLVRAAARSVLRAMDEHDLVGIIDKAPPPQNPQQPGMMPPEGAPPNGQGPPPSMENPGGDAGAGEGPPGPPQ